SGFQNAPSIPTFVVGVGDSVAAMNEIAAAGGTGQAVIVDVTSDAQKQIHEALDQIRAALACTYDVPTPDVGLADLPTAQVLVLFGGDKSDKLVRVPGPSQCPDDSSVKAWYLDDVSNPARVVLCPAACEWVMAAPEAQIQIEVGCSTTPQ